MIYRIDIFRSEDSARIRAAAIKQNRPDAAVEVKFVAHFVVNDATGSAETSKTRLGAWIVEARLQTEQLHAVIDPVRLSAPW